MCTDYVPHVYHGEFPVLSSFPFCFISVNDFHSKLISLTVKKLRSIQESLEKNGVQHSRYETTLLFLFIISSELFSCRVHLVAIVTPSLFNTSLFCIISIFSSMSFLSSYECVFIYHIYRPPVPQILCNFFVLLQTKSSAKEVIQNIQRLIEAAREGICGRTMASKDIQVLFSGNSKCCMDCLGGL